MNEFRLQVWCMGHWVWGRNQYKSYQAAKDRVQQLKGAGIKARIRENSELFN